MLPDVSSAHILDAGCGSGFYTAELLKRGARVTGIDSSREMLKHAEEKLRDFGSQVTLRVADLTRPLDFLESGSVDGILAPLVMHYIREWKPTLSEFRRVLRPNGWLLISTHHPTTEAGRFNVANYFVTEPMEDYWHWVGNVRFYRRPLTAIAGAITDAGFVIDKLVEPLPDEVFLELKPEAFEQILKYPDFLMIRARVTGDK